MMANAMFMPRCPYFAGTMEYPVARGRANVNHLSPITRQLLATDPIGNTTLTLQNVVTGSHIQIETQDGTVTRLFDTYTTGDPAITLDVYQAGSALNDLRIKIRKGSASPYYLPYETQVTASTTPISIYVSQISDE